MSSKQLVVKDINQVDQEMPTFLAIGVFDGVHRGHKELVGRMVDAAKQQGRRSAVLTFHPHPGSIIRGQFGRLYLSSLEERINLLSELGLDLIIAQSFDQTLRQTSATDFIDLLCQKIQLDQLWGGAFGLGYQREGDLRFLQTLGMEKGFTVHQFQAVVEYRGRLVSSSRVRNALNDGDLDDVEGCLGRPYQISGTVIPGDGRGRQLGIPTANLSIWEEQVLPTEGVYAATAVLGDALFIAAVNVGYRPTVNGHSLNVEAHLLDFDRQIYGQSLTLNFLTRIRDEQKFDGLDDLVAQIHKDIIQVRQAVSANIEFNNRFP